MAEKKHPVNDLLADTIERVREVVDTNTVVGEPIVAGEVILIPVSNISVGFGSGGSDLAEKGNAKEYSGRGFGGGGGAGLRITPVCFLVVKGEDVRVLPMVSDPTGLAGVGMLVDQIPGVVAKIGDFIQGRKEKKEEKPEQNS